MTLFLYLRAIRAATACGKVAELATKNAENERLREALVATARALHAAKHVVVSKHEHATILEAIAVARAALGSTAQTPTE